jgi:hypothetical protein
MIGKKNESSDTPENRDRPMGQDRPGGDCLSGQTPSRLSAAIMRILATARGATEGRRTITPADLSPPRSSDRGDTQGRNDEDAHDGDAASRVEWSLRMMQ